MLDNKSNISTKQNLKWRNNMIVKMFKGQPQKVEIKNKKEYIVLEDPELKTLLNHYKSHDDVEKISKKHKIELKEKILEFGDDETNFTCDGFYISRCKSPATFDIEQMRRDGIDVDKYAKPTGNGFYKILMPKR